MDFGGPWDPSWGALCNNFGDFFDIFCVKVGGWVADLPFKWFWGAKVTSEDWQNVDFPSNY